MGTCTKCGQFTDSDPDYCGPGMCARCSNSGLSGMAGASAEIRDLRAILAAELPRGTCDRCGQERRVIPMGEDRLCPACARKERAVLMDRLEAAREANETASRYLGWIEEKAARLTTGNVGHDGNAILLFARNAQSRMSRSLSVVEEAK